MATTLEPTVHAEEATTLARHWVGGAWTDIGVRSTSHNPATGEALGDFADGGREAAEKAVAAARIAFTGSSWRNDRKLRAAALSQLADRFEARLPEIAALFSSENGKPIPEAMFELGTVAPKLRYWAAMALTLQGRASEPEAGRLSLVIRQPIGVAGIITPWNAPVALAIRSLAPALAAGTTAVIKMPGQTALTNALFASILAEVPALGGGIVNIFTESGSEGARFLVESTDVPVISFTGSTHTGRAIAAAGAAKLKRLGLELGGKTPMIVFDDANLSMVVPVATAALTTFAGQFCMTGSRLLVQEGVADQVIAGLTASLSAIRLGPGNDAETQMGPLIDKAGVERVDGLVEAAITAGARVLVRGGPSADPRLAAGAFYHPTFLEIDDASLPIVRDETFGPVLTVQRFRTEAEAIRLANDSDYGLAASIWSGNAERLFRVGRELEAGTIWMNNWAMIYDEFEEGGFKQSGLGRLNGASGIDAFLEYKHLALAPGIVGE